MFQAGLPPSRSGLPCHVISPTRKEDAVIDEGLKILARLDADGKLSDDQKGWSKSFLTLRNGSQEAGAATR